MTCPVAFRAPPDLAARQIESWAFWFAREMVNVVNDLWQAAQPQKCFLSAPDISQRIRYYSRPQPTYISEASAGI